MLNQNELHWFPLRIRNSSLTRLQAMKDRLEQHDDVEETYVPLMTCRISICDI